MSEKLFEQSQVELLDDIIGAIEESKDFIRFQAEYSYLTKTTQEFNEKFSEVESLLPQETFFRLEEVCSLYTNASMRAGLIYGMSIARLLENGAANSQALGNFTFIKDDRFHERNGRRT